MTKQKLANKLIYGDFWKTTCPAIDKLARKHDKKYVSQNNRKLYSPGS